MELVFASIVFGSYQKFIPYYIYSINVTHPSAAIKIFVETALNEKISRVLKILQRNNFQFEIVELPNSFKEFDDVKMKGAGGKINNSMVDRL